MDKFYIVTQEPNTDIYDLMRVNEGARLEEIDLYTSKFKDKEEFIKHLKEQDIKASNDADVFIAYRKKDGSIGHLDLVYGYYKLEKYAEKSLKGNTTTEESIKEIVKEANKHNNFQDLIRRKYFNMYEETREIVLSSLNKEYIKYPMQSYWLRNSYRVGRDALAAVDEYFLIKDKVESGNIERLKQEKRELDQSRSIIDPIISIKLDNGIEQMTIIGEQRSYVNLNYINGKIITKKDLELVKTAKEGKMVNEKASKITDIEDIKIDYSKYQNIAKLLLSLSYRRVKVGRGERFEIDFSKANLELTDEEERSLNRLLQTRLRKYAFYAKFYGSQNTGESRREGRRYARSVSNAIEKGAKKKTELYTDAYKFYEIYKSLNRKPIGFDDVVTFNEEETNERVPRR